MRRWKIEERFRFQKTELPIEALRLHDWEPRRTMLLWVTLASGFLLSLLTPSLLLARSLIFPGRSAPYRGGLPFGISADLGSKTLRCVMAP